MAYVAGKHIGKLYTVMLWPADVASGLNYSGSTQSTGSLYKLKLPRMQATTTANLAAMATFLPL